jgi:hypothetical protein
MTIYLPGLGRPMKDEGMNHKTKEYWTVIAGRKIYAKSLEALYRTVAYGWVSHKEKSICIYCGREWYDLSNPCHCLMNKGDMGKRVLAMKKLHEIMSAQEAKEKAKEEKKKPAIILPK